MNFKEYNSFIDSLPKSEISKLLLISMSEDMLKQRHEIWQKNYNKLKDTPEWIEKLKVRDSLLGKDIQSDEDNAKLEEIEDWIDDVMLSEYFDILVSTYKNQSNLYYSLKV